MYYYGYQVKYKVDENRLNSAIRLQSGIVCAINYADAVSKICDRYGGVSILEFTYLEQIAEIDFVLEIPREIITNIVRGEYENYYDPTGGFEYV